MSNNKDTIDDFVVEENVNMDTEANDSFILEEDIVCYN